ncbi:MAG: TonB family protein, partial [Candidatus Fermentibacterota bacterium]
VFTVNPDGTTRWEAVRTSGTPAFDRAVEHALAMANVPPPPPGRTGPTEVRIEFLGPQSD